MTFLVASEIQKNVAKRSKERRKFLKYSRETAAEISGVPESTIRKYEDCGEISYRQFLMLLQAYGDLSIMDAAFENPPAKTMEELITLASGDKK
ncbi:MAG: helix-turn-helix transcriptional regulator [Pseudomonadales bacterium]